MTARHGYRRVCSIPGRRHDVFGPSGKQVGFIKKHWVDGWCWRLWSHDWICMNESLDEAYEQVVQAHGDLVATLTASRERTEGAG